MLCVIILFYDFRSWSSQTVSEMESVGLRAVGSHCSLSEMDDLDLNRALLDRPRLKIERKRSFDERSMSELSRHDSPRGRSVLDTPLSSARNSFEPHPMMAEAWEALRRSMVFFRGLPVGTLAAVDNTTDEVLNYDQVPIKYYLSVGWLVALYINLNAVFCSCRCLCVILYPVHWRF